VALGREMRGGMGGKKGNGGEDSVIGYH